MASERKVQGFTLLELIVVIAGLGILAGLAFPNFLKYLEFAQIDEAKSLLNSAAAECLQKLRTSNWTDTADFQPEVLKSRDAGGLPGNYVYNEDRKTCSYIEIHDPSSESTLFPLLGFQTEPIGKISKIARYFNNESKQVAESWGKSTPSESATYLGNCKKREEQCNTNLAAALQSANDGKLTLKAWTGQCKWPADPSCGCEREVWSCDKKAYFKIDDFQTCLKAKASAQCNSHRDTIRSQTPPYTGADTAGVCPTTEWWLDGDFIGEDVQRYNDAVIAKQAALAEKNRLECEAQKKSWIDKKVSGKFTPTISGCGATWGCLEKDNIFTTYPSQADYDSSTCAAPPPPPPPPKCIRINRYGDPERC